MENHEAVHRRYTNYELTVQQWRNVTLPRCSRISRSARLFLILRATSRDIRRPCSSTFTESARVLHSFRVTAVSSRGGKPLNFFCFRTVAQLLPSPPPWKGDGCSLKNERGPLVCPCFIFISFLSPRFLAPFENNMPPFTDNIMSGYADTWEEGEMLGGGKEVNNVTDVQDFTVKFFLSFSVCRRNKTVAGVEEAEGYRVLLSPVPPAFPLCEFSLPKRPSIE